MPASAIRSWMAANSSGVTMTCRWTFRLRFSISVPAPGLSGALWTPLPYQAVLRPAPGAWVGWAYCWVRRQSCCSSAPWRARRFSDSCLFRACRSLYLYSAFYPLNAFLPTHTLKFSILSNHFLILWYRSFVFLSRDVLIIAWELLIFYRFFLPTHKFKF